MLVKKRLGAGLEYSVAYTYSKCMTNNMGYYGQGGQASQSNWYYQNIYDAAAEWGPCDYDAQQNFVANAVYDIPFGRGRTFGNGMNKAVDAVVGGWTMAGILSVHSGFPLTIGASDASNTTSRGPRADCLTPVDILGYTECVSVRGIWLSMVQPQRFRATRQRHFWQLRCRHGTRAGLDDVRFQCVEDL